MESKDVVTKEDLDALATFLQEHIDADNVQLKKIEEKLNGYEQRQTISNLGVFLGTQVSMVGIDQYKKNHQNYVITAILIARSYRDLHIPFDDVRVTMDRLTDQTQQMIDCYQRNTDLAARILANQDFKSADSAAK